MGTISLVEDPDPSLASAAGSPAGPAPLDPEATARLGTLGIKLITAAVGLSVFVAGVWALLAIGSTADAVATLLVAVFSVVPIVLARRHRAALAWVRYYPPEPVSTVVDGADESEDPLLELDEATLAALQQVRRFDLALLVALAPGFLLLARYGLGPHPFNPALSEARSLLFYRGLFAVAVMAIGSAWILRPMPGRFTDLGQVLWILLIAAAGLWSANFVFDGGRAQTYETSVAAEYHDPSALDSTGPIGELADPPPSLRLAAVPGAGGGFTIHDPDAAWSVDHKRGEPVQVVVKPGLLGMPWIQRLEFGSRSGHPKPSKP